MNQYEALYDFNDKNRLKFNQDLFNRTDEATIEAIKKVILSCQRDRFFTIKVVSFTVIEDYEKIIEVLRRYEESMVKNKNKSKKKDNQYDYINIKDSDILLLVVKYYVKFEDESEYVDVYLAIPRLIDKYYFRLSGNYYSAMYQIVDGSTYNNTTSTNKSHSVIFKTNFMKITVYREFHELRTVRKEVLKCTYYRSRIFNKTLSVIKYIMAKFGFYDGLAFLNASYIRLTEDDPEDDNLYTFQSRNKGIFISVPKLLFDSDAVIQSVVYSLYKDAIEKDTEYQELYTDAFWIKSLGLEFNNQTIEKGYSILDSLECVYDIGIMEILHLPDEVRSSVYGILRWIIGDFSNLRLKDNRNLGSKRIRYSEYIAALYAIKLSQGIYRVSDLGKRIKLKAIERAIMINPMQLIKDIKKCTLITYRNLVSDMDSLTAIKFTHKGIAGIGESNSSSVPNSFRAVDISHLGRIDLDASSASDPGMSGTLCPLAPLADNMYFTDYQEPNFWDSEIKDVINKYKQMTGLRDVLAFEQDVLKRDNSERIEMLKDDISTIKKLIVPIYKVEDESEIGGLPIDPQGVIQVE